MAPFIVSIEGNIGSGKSTVMNHLKEHLTVIGNRSVVYVDEPLDQWMSIKNKDGVNMLELFYTDPKKYAFSFQMMAYISRLANLHNTIEKHPNNIIVMERSLLTDYNVFAKMLHESADLLDEEYAIYKMWFYHFNDIDMDALIYLQCSPEVSMERYTNRNRTGESLSLEYMTKVHERHEQWIHNMESRPLLIIDNEVSSIDDSLFAIEDFLNDMVCPHDEINHFMENIYSSYIVSKLILGWFVYMASRWF
jgi:deoxyadenosine/deoxycytidine kinase